MPGFDFTTSLTHLDLIGGLSTIAGAFVAISESNLCRELSTTRMVPPEGPGAHLTTDGAERPMPAMLSGRHDTPPQQDNRRPHEQQRREPIFGLDAPRSLVELIITVGALGLVLLALLLAASVREKASRLLFGGSQHSQPENPDRAVTLDGYKLKRIDYARR